MDPPAPGSWSRQDLYPSPMTCHRAAGHQAPTRSGNWGMSRAEQCSMSPDPRVRPSEFQSQHGHYMLVQYPANSVTSLSQTFFSPKNGHNTQKRACLVDYCEDEGGRHGTFWNPSLFASIASGHRSWCTAVPRGGTGSVTRHRQV